MKTLVPMRASTRSRGGRRAMWDAAFVARSAAEMQTPNECETERNSEMSRMCGGTWMP